MINVQKLYYFATSLADCKFNFHFFFNYSRTVMIAIVRLLYCSVSDNIFVTCITVTNCYSFVQVLFQCS